MSTASAAAAAANGEGATMSPSLGVAGAGDSLMALSIATPTGELPCRCMGVPTGSAGCLLSSEGGGLPAPGAWGGSGDTWAGPWLRSTSARLACAAPWNGLEGRAEMRTPGQEPTLVHRQAHGGAWKRGGSRRPAATPGSAPAGRAQAVRSRRQEGVASPGLCSTAAEPGLPCWTASSKQAEPAVRPSGSAFPAGWAFLTCPDLLAALATSCSSKGGGKMTPSRSRLVCIRPGAGQGWAGGLRRVHATANGELPRMPRDKRRDLAHICSKGSRRAAQQTQPPGPRQG